MADSDLGNLIKVVLEGSARLRTQIAGLAELDKQASMSIDVLREALNKHFLHLQIHSSLQQSKSSSLTVIEVNLKETVAQEIKELD